MNSFVVDPVSWKMHQSASHKRAGILSFFVAKMSLIPSTSRIQGNEYIREKWLMFDFVWLNNLRKPQVWFFHWVSPNPLWGQWISKFHNLSALMSTCITGESKFMSCWDQMSARCSKEDFLSFRVVVVSAVALFWNTYMSWISNRKVWSDEFLNSLYVARICNIGVIPNLTLWITSH